MNGFLPSILHYLTQSAGSVASLEALRFYPFSFRIALADGLGKERDVIYALDGNEYRTVFAMTFTAIAPVGDVALPSGGASFSLENIDVLLQYEGADLIIPEFSFDSGVYVRQNYMTWANEYAPIPYTSGGGVPNFIQRAAGFKPLLYKIGPGGHLRVGGRKTVGAGIGDEWYIYGSIWTWKNSSKE